MTTATIPTANPFAWTVEDHYFTGSVIDTRGQVTVVLRRGSIVQHVKATPVEAADLDIIVNRANHVR